MTATPPSSPLVRPVEFHRTPTPRPVDPEWTCHRDGACCTQPPEVVMTLQERLVFLRALPEGVKTEWRHVEENFVAVKAAPCPAYLFGECQVYESRPYNCRRFACLRPDPKTEPWDGYNLMDRVALSRVARRLAYKIQRKAARWAYKHGWPMKDGD